MEAIKLYSTKQEAKYFKNSQINSFYEFGGIQLIPNQSYSQRIFNFDLIAPFIATVLSVRDDKVLGTLTYSISSDPITDSIYADNVVVYADSPILQADSFTGGTNSFTITPTQDFGNELIYLSFNEICYSSPFFITALDEDRCTKIVYKELPSEIYQSIGLKIWFRQKSKQSELTTYYESSTKNTVTQAVKSHKLEMYESEFMSIDDLILVSEILESAYLYIDNIRYSLFEAVKIPELTQQENFGKIKFTLSPNN